MVSRAEMSRIAKRLARLPVAERRKIEGIGPRRAEIIVAGATVYHVLLERLHLKGFRYSPLGLRDGILAQMAADYDRSTRSGRQIESERWESIMTAVDHYHIDRKHALDVRDAATLLFTGLRSLHRLPPEYREWLSAAAMLYEVGDYVNRNGRHRHTHYIISNSEILGYTPQQRRLIAAIARYLGKSRPTLEDGPMKLVDPTDRANVEKAILLLRLARALNLGRSRAVEKVRIGVRSAEVRLTLVPRRRSGVDLELWAIEKECNYFREVFGRELSTAVS
jgi:exopolyphosphatase/guanosine-5'-triphosphate,3'-diphosphate pyrophosphatase